MAKGDDTAVWLVEFGVGALTLCERMPKTAAGTHIGGQLLRSGTAGAPNYAEARSAESLQDFVHTSPLGRMRVNLARLS